ncbi:DNA circularization N-terminal domain-containing protein, partial [Kingella kingae]
MTMWHTVLQDASYKGVRFDVVNIEESDGKALVEHARAFANGTTLEDMGTTGRQVQIAAVFWGKGYHSRLNKLVETLMQSGAGVLVHPVWGRLQNMVATSWHFRHEADNVDYATLDITFRESGEAQKIFVFENQFLMEIENLIAQIDGYRAALE